MGNLLFDLLVLGSRCRDLLRSSCEKLLFWIFNQLMSCYNDHVICGGRLGGYCWRSGTSSGASFLSPSLTWSLYPAIYGRTIPSDLRRLDVGVDLYLQRIRRRLENSKDLSCQSNAHGESICTIGGEYFFFRQNIV